MDNIAENFHAAPLSATSSGAFIGSSTDHEHEMIEGHRPRLLGDRLRPRDTTDDEDDDQDIIPIF